MSYIVVTDTSSIKPKSKKALRVKIMEQKKPQRQKKIKDISRKILDLSNFHLSKYEGCRTLNATGWANCLYTRFLIKGSLLGEKNRTEKTVRYGTDVGLNLLWQIFETPIPTRNLDKPIWSPQKYEAVTDVEMYTLWRARDWFEKLPEATKACEILDQELSGKPEEQDAPSLAYQSFHSHLLEKNQWGWRHDEPLVYVNMRATDDQIISQFENWLRRKREELEKFGLPKPPRKFSKADFRKWHEHKVLAFIDLEMLAYHLDLVLTDEMIGNRLFPDDIDLDVSEKVRKTVRPLAAWLMESSTIDALDWRSGFDHSTALKE